MIRIGLNNKEKEKIINNYIKNLDLKKILILYKEYFKPDFNFNVNKETEIEYLEWDDIIQYPPFYRLLEEVDNNVLIIINELMRKQNRSELTYNCTHHYLNQTQHVITFEYFPFIKNKKDTMMLLDFENKNKYRGKSFEYKFIQEEDFKIKPINIDFNINLREVNELQKQSYEKQKEKEFDELGRSDPDIIPRHLHLFAGKFKKPYIKSNKLYVARNKRFKQDNIVTYRDLREKKTEEERIIIDFPYRQIEFNDYLKTTGSKNVTFLSTGLPVDEYYSNEFQKWLDRLEEFYDKASIY